MTTKMPKWLEDKRDGYSEKFAEFSYRVGFRACFDLVVPDLLDALKSVAPSWLPEAVREKRRAVLERYEGKED